MLWMRPIQRISCELCSWLTLCKTLKQDLGIFSTHPCRSLLWRPAMPLKDPHGPCVSPWAHTIYPCTVDLFFYKTKMSRHSPLRSQCICISRKVFFGTTETSLPKSHTQLKGQKSCLGWFFWHLLELLPSYRLIPALPRWKPTLILLSLSLLPQNPAQMPWGDRGPVFLATAGWSENEGESPGSTWSSHQGALHFIPVSARGGLLINGTLLDLLELIKHMHTHINPSVPLPNHWLAERVLFPALTSCPSVILRPGCIKFHWVWVYWRHSEVYVVIEISLDGQGYGQGIRRAGQPCGVGMTEMLGCLEPSPRKIKAGSFAAANESNKTLPRDGRWDVIVSRPAPIPPNPPGAPLVPKILPRAMEAGLGGLRLIRPSAVRG